jgi:hypothetical protein
MVNTYADNFATLTCGRAAYFWQQRQADWLSAFCAFSGIQLHPDKIVAIELEKKFPGRLEHIIVHDHSLNELPVKSYDVMGGTLKNTTTSTSSSLGI